MPLSRAYWTAKCVSVLHESPFPFIPASLNQWRRHGVDMSTPLLLEVAPKIDKNPTSFYMGRGRSASPSTLAMSVHPTYFDLATPLQLVTIIETKLASVSLCCKCHCFKTANIKILSIHISTEASYHICTSQWPVINVKLTSVLIMCG